jgi:hypothetical protein
MTRIILTLNFKKTEKFCLFCFLGLTNDDKSRYNVRNHICLLGGFKILQCITKICILLIANI